MRLEEKVSVEWGYVFFYISVETIHYYSFYHLAQYRFDCLIERIIVGIELYLVLLKLCDVSLVFLNRYLIQFECDCINISDH